MESISNDKRTLIHISHLHPLKLVASPEPRPLCHACNMLCADQSYGCLDCRYFLHATCATTKRRIDHISHPAHTLVLELNPPCLGCTCDACGEDANYTFLLTCRECNFCLHLHCAALPLVNHQSHSHPLSIICGNPFPANSGPYTCDQCKRYLDVDKFFYLCALCNFGGHVGCFPPENLEVLSTGLQAPEAPASMAQHPELDKVTQIATEVAMLQLKINEVNSKRQLEKELLQMEEAQLKEQREQMLSKQRLQLVRNQMRRLEESMEVYKYI